MTYIDVVQTRLDPAGPSQERADAILGSHGHVYACLDANRITNLPEILQSSGLAHRCLFQGELAETVGHQAPWLVRLSGEDRLLHQLLTPQGQDKPDPFAFWETEAGIYIHTTMPIADLHKHLRRFLRVQSLEGRTFFFRFWEPSIAQAYFGGLDQRIDLINRWFHSREGGVISSIVVADPTADTPVLTHLNAQDIDLSAPAPTGAFTLSHEDVQRFTKVRMDRDILQLSSRLAETFPEAAQAVAGGSMAEFTRVTMSRLMQFGFGKKSILFTLLAWELHYGPNFESRDPEGQLGRTLADPLPQNEKFEILKKRMSALG